MECISELKNSLNVYFAWNKARMACFVNVLLALLATRLVYYKIHSDIYEAITGEKRIKKWNRQWKINLIEQNNPQWLDLSIGLF